MLKQKLLPLAALFLAATYWAHASSGISLSTTALSFNGSSGNVSTQPLTITATANSVSINRTTFSTPVFSDGPITLPITLQHGQSVTLRISAQPETTASSGTLTIRTSTGRSSVSLSETATVPTVSHSVSLNWTAPVASPIAVSSYQVQRTAAGSTQYAAVGSSSTTSWADSSVQSGLSYAYQVVAVATNGVKSNPSNRITLTIP